MLIRDQISKREMMVLKQPLTEKTKRTKNLLPTTSNDLNMGNLIKKISLNCIEKNVFKYFNWDTRF